ncbi:MAG: thiamine diphosphokinase [Anaerolineales bacterium]
MMNKCIIFANGQFSSVPNSINLNQIIIAADGGARHCLESGINPQFVIGDFDSLSEEELTFLKSNGVELIKYSTQKDETDLELAVNFAINQGCRDISVYGAFGGRLDMTFANILLLASPIYTGIHFKIIGTKTTAYILRSGETLELKSKPGTTVSIIPLGGSATGITYNGLKWPLEKAILPFGTPKGVSNQTTQNISKIFLEEGIILIFVIDSDAF